MPENGLTPGSLLAGKFRIVRVLGEGGMGAVYEIEHELTKHRRALKLLHPEMARVPSVVERFLREASAAGRVGNPHIVETFDAGVLETGEPYLVMELLRGEPLTQRIARGPMLVPEVVDVIGQACSGVSAAHSAGIVHRDLKPDNLFIVDVDGRPFVKILDFGISKFDPHKTGGMALTREGAALGTPYYMPPEQIRGETNLDARADVYALGVILYECLAGRRPFEADQLPQLAVLIHTGQPVPLAQARPDLPPGFADLVHHAMAAEREQRFQTADELRLSLERFGGLSFRVPSIISSSLPPPSVVQARTLGSSAVGVSMPASSPTRGSRGALYATLAAMLAFGGAGAFWLLRGGSPDAATEQAPRAGSAAPSEATAEPAPKAEPRLAPTPADPPPSTAGVASAAPGSAASPAPSGSEAVPPAPAVKSAPVGTRSSPSRAAQRGLARDNPFK